MHPKQQPRPLQHLDQASIRPATRVGARPLFSPDDHSGAGTSGEAAPRILIVEDDFLVSSEIESELTAAGFSVVGIAASASDALEMAVSRKPDLVVMDIALDGPSDGVDAAIEIFKATGTRSLFASAHYDRDTQQRAQPCAPLGWVAKPYAMSTLVQAVSEALRGTGRN